MKAKSSASPGFEIMLSHMIWLFLAAAWANTEVLTFELADSPPVNNSWNLANPYRGQIFGGLEQIPVHGDPGPYFCRVCWPATQPGDFEVKFSDNSILVNVERDVYPIGHPLGDIRYEITCSVARGVPRDIIPMIGWIVFALFIGVVACNFISF